MILTRLLVKRLLLGGKDSAQRLLGVHVERGIDIPHVNLDSLVRDSQFFRYLPLRPALSEQGKHIYLPCGEPIAKGDGIYGLAVEGPRVPPSGRSVPQARSSFEVSVT